MRIADAFSDGAYAVNFDHNYLGKTRCTIKGPCDSRFIVASSVWVDAPEEAFGLALPVFKERIAEVLRPAAAIEDDLEGLLG